MAIIDLDTYGQEELRYFKCLTAHEKISFIDSVYTTGISNTLSDFLAREDFTESTTPLVAQTIDFKGYGQLHVLVFEDEIILYSNHLKTIRLYIKQLFHTGNILSKQHMRKPRGFGYRYYARYSILSHTLPLCPN
jgi:hypothetical protein